MRMHLHIICIYTTCAAGARGSTRGLAAGRFPVFVFVVRTTHSPHPCPHFRRWPAREERSAWVNMLRFDLKADFFGNDSDRVWLEECVTNRKLHSVNSEKSAKNWSFILAIRGQLLSYYYYHRSRQEVACCRAYFSLPAPAG